jgi:hypothetical protein
MQNACACRVSVALRPTCEHLEYQQQSLYGSFKHETSINKSPNFSLPARCSLIYLPQVCKILMKERQHYIFYFDHVVVAATASSLLISLSGAPIIDITCSAAVGKMSARVQ